jgi:mRNA-degrading endonuclease toxin of MazEF toxin-antitoxin module
VTPTRGEVWWHEPPEDEPRPFVILTRNEAIAGLEKLVAVPTFPGGNQGGSLARAVQVGVELRPRVVQRV